MNNEIYNNYNDGNGFSGSMDATCDDDEMSCEIEVSGCEDDDFADVGAYTVHEDERDSYTVNEENEEVDTGYIRNIEGDAICGAPIINDSHDADEIDFSRSLLSKQDNAAEAIKKISNEMLEVMKLDVVFHEKFPAGIQLCNEGMAEHRVVPNPPNPAVLDQSKQGDKEDTVEDDSIVPNHVNDDEDTPDGDRVQNDVNVDKEYTAEYDELVPNPVVIRGLNKISNKRINVITKQNIQCCCHANI